MYGPLLGKPLVLRSRTNSQVRSNDFGTRGEFPFLHYFLNVLPDGLDDHANWMVMMNIARDAHLRDDLCGDSRSSGQRRIDDALLHGLRSGWAANSAGRLFGGVTVYFWASRTRRGEPLIRRTAVAAAWRGVAEDRELGVASRNTQIRTKVGGLW